MIRKYLSLSICALALTACGGGSDSGSSSPTPTAQNPTTPMPSQPASTPTPVQTGDSVHLSGATLSAYNRLNLARKQCGFNPLTYNTELEKSASNHINYLKVVAENSKTAYASHGEVADSISMLTGANNPYFSGINASSRVEYKTSNNKAMPVNYDAMAVSENIALHTMTTLALIPNLPTTDNTAVNLLDGLLAAPYHQRTLFLPLFTEVGININHLNYQTNQSNSRVDYLEVMLGLPSVAKQLPKLGHLATYPCEGITDTEYELTNEEPNPFGSRDLATNPVGQPIYFYTNDSKTLATQTVNLTQNNNPVEIITLNADNDPNKLLGKNEFFIVPNKRLTPSTAYKVNYTVNYTDGTTDKGEFTFTTKK